MTWGREDTGGSGVLATLIWGHAGRCKGFPGSSVSKEPAYNEEDAGDNGFSSWVGKIHWRRAQQPTPVFFLENPMDRGAWPATVHRLQRVGQDWNDWARMHAGFCESLKGSLYCIYTVSCVLCTVSTQPQGPTASTSHCWSPPGTGRRVQRRFLWSRSFTKAYWSNEWLKEDLDWRLFLGGKWWELRW